LIAYGFTVGDRSEISAPTEGGSGPPQEGGEGNYGVRCL